MKAKDAKAQIEGKLKKTEKERGKLEAEAKKFVLSLLERQFKEKLDHALALADTKDIELFLDLQETKDQIHSKFWYDYSQDATVIFFNQKRHVIVFCDACSEFGEKLRGDGYKVSVGSNVQSSRSLSEDVVGCRIKIKIPVSPELKASETF